MVDKYYQLEVLSYINFLWANASGKGAFSFANWGNFIFSGGNFINIRVNQSKLKNFGGNSKIIWGKCVSGI